MSNFSNYKLSNELLKSIQLLNYQNPTPVQEKVIPILLDKKDVIVKSKTGSGKTAAFAIPICELIDWLENKPQVLVVVPTRELAIQVKDDFFNIGRFKRLKASAVYGKAPFDTQVKELKQKTHIVTGTPGRIIDHLDRGTLDVSNVEYLVIDEADEMLKMGFIEQVEKIINRLERKRVTILLSATMPKDIESLCTKYLNEPMYVEVENNTTTNTIEQERYLVEESDKINLLKDLLVVEKPDSCIIFSNFIQKVDDIHKELDKMDISCRKIHGGMEQDERLQVMNDFRQGHFRYLVATDVAARGIDIDNISLIINYDMPHDKEYYVHRIGRTGRQNKLGKAITFMTQNEEKYLKEVEHYVGYPIQLKERPDRQTVKNERVKFLEKMKSVPSVKKIKGEAFNKEIMKLHITGGKKSKIRPTDIVGIISNIDGVSAEDIGIINILDIATFVEILNNKGDLVIRELQNIPIKGKKRKVSQANK